jgi:SAM-dependent MidA family methyltransferase
MPRVNHAGARELSALLEARVLAAVREAGGWLPFDRYMALVLYEPGLGYYARGAPIFGRWPGAAGRPGEGSDFITAPELSPLFGAALARQVAEVLREGGLGTVFEFGAGSGALAEQVLGALDAMGVPVARYAIVDLTGALRARQQERLAPFGERVQWLDRWPERIEGVVIGNEVLDAMPVKLLHWDGRAWFERGVVAAPPARTDGKALAFGDRPTTLAPAVREGWPPGAQLEIHPQAEAFVRTLAAHLVRGAAFFIDYGFPEAEYYHPQRHQGTLMCHCAHESDTDPLASPGQKDITSHVNFTGIALAAQEEGLEVIGYTTQARFLLNCGLLSLLQQAAASGAGPRATSAAQKLVVEHEMGELFKVIGLARGLQFAAQSSGPSGPSGHLGFRAGDRTHTL